MPFRVAIRLVLFTWVTTLLCCYFVFPVLFPNNIQSSVKAQVGPSRWEVGEQIVPTAVTTVQATTVHVDRMGLVNTSGTAVTVTLTDLSTNCVGAGCPFWSALINSGQSYTVDLGGNRANSGFTWAASGAGVNGWLRGTL